MPLGTEVGLGLGDIVLGGDPAPQRGTAPQFLAHVRCGQMAGWIKMPLRKEDYLRPSEHIALDWIGMEVSLSPGDFVLDGDQLPSQRGMPPNFRPKSIVAKRSPISATAELLLDIISAWFHK